ncbi:MAG: tetratricopeptide repeat protein [Fuerstiella sp.]|nr:tetratricopeptide repeat protein [Fuerstiella sp.]
MTTNSDTSADSPPPRKIRWLVMPFVVLGIAVIISIARRPTPVNFPSDFLPPGLAADLQADIRRAQGQIREVPSAHNWGRLGELCMAHELLPQAQVCFRESTRLAENDPKWWYLQAVMLQKVNAPDAVDGFRTAVRLYPNAPAAHLRLGQTLARIGRFDDAEESLTVAAEQSNQHPAALQALAQLKVMNSDITDAIQLITQAANDARAGWDIMRESQRIIALRQHDIASVEQPRVNNTRPFVTKPIYDPWLAGVAGRSPRIAEMTAMADRLAAQGQLDAARRLYERVIKMEDRNSRPHIYHAMVLLNSGDLNNAMSEIRVACTMFPDDALAYSCRGAIEARRGDLDAAISSLRQAVLLKPDFVDAHRVLLMMYLQKESRSDVETQFQTLLALDPSDLQLREQYITFMESLPP